MLLGDFRNINLILGSEKEKRKFNCENTSIKQYLLFV